MSKFFSYTLVTREDGSNVHKLTLIGFSIMVETFFHDVVESTTFYLGFLRFFIGLKLLKYNKRGVSE